MFTDAAFGLWALIPGLLGTVEPQGPPVPAELAAFVEGEACRRHNWSAPVTDNADYADCYGGGHLMCAMDGDPPGGGYEASFDIDVPQDGTFVVWLAATLPGTGSPLSVSVDGGPRVAVQSAARVGGWGPGQVLTWLPAARVGLAQGRHTVTVGVTERRQYDNRYYAYLDAVALEQVGDDPSVAFATYPTMPEITETPIRFYSGNASVGWFMQYWGTGREGDTGAIDADMIALLKRCGCTAMCDFPAWCRTEEEPGRWDWSFYQRNARLLHEAGLQYNTFAWLHFPPKWFMDTGDYVPYRCLEHGEALQQTSLWAPFTLRLYDEFYRRLAEDFGDEIDFIRLAMPSEYGEIGYATGMTNWLVPQEHVHGGYWCGDPYALEDFRGAMRARFGQVAALNESWGTDFADWADVAPPDVREHAGGLNALASRAPTDRRRWLDFVDWYQSAWSGFAVRTTEIVKRHFPGKAVILSLGYGAEPVPWGNDQSRHIKALASVGAAAQTPGDIGYFATRRVSTACRVYGVPYYTEPPGSVDRRRQVRRIFYDISNGTQTWFDYPTNLDGSRDLLDEYKVHMTGRPAVCDVAFMMPSVWWWCHPDWQWPQQTIALAEGLRDRLDYEVMDELLVQDGGLEQLGIRLLVLAEGDFMQSETLGAIRDWVEAGGVLVLVGVDRVESIEGDAAPFQGLCPEQTVAPATIEQAWRSSGRDVSKGHVVFLPAGEANAAACRDALVALTYRLNDIDPRYGNAPCVDDVADGVVTTLFADRVLLYNGTGGLVRKTLRFRESDFTAGAKRPPAWETEVVIPANRIGAVLFE